MTIICYSSFFIWNSVCNLTIVHKVEERQILQYLYAMNTYVYIVVYELISCIPYIGQPWTRNKFVINAITKYLKRWIMHTKILMNTKSNCWLGLYKKNRLAERNFHLLIVQYDCFKHQTNSYKSNHSWTEEKRNHWTKYFQWTFNPLIFIIFLDFVFGNAI